VLDQLPGAPTALVDFPPTEPGLGRRQLTLHQPRTWLVAHDPSQVAKLLDDAHELARQGLWLVGWVAYEAAPGLEPGLPVKALPPGQPYAIWAAFDADQVGTLASRSESPPSSSPWSAGPWRADLAEADAGQRIEAIRSLIEAGEVYQVNLTTRLRGPFSGGASALQPFFDALRRSQPEGYGLMLDARAACRSPGVVLSVSPELFFDWDGELITTRPMKGTAPRGADRAADEAAAQHLLHSPKERAENLMIVDLLRNDLSRIAEVGSVRVPSLFDLEALPTVWQMTSTITARSRAGLRLSEAFRALFPCGSVTGAPKRQAMHHIARLETAPRGVYCGAVGVMAPGGRVTFNVPIRTVVLNTPPPPAPWSAVCGVGSGITLDARPDSEWREWQAKRGFLDRASQPFELLESMRLEAGRFDRLERHLDRLQRAAGHFGFRLALGEVTQALDALAATHPAGTFKARLRVTPSGQVLTEAAPLLAPSADPPRVRLASAPMPPVDDFIRYKTTRREAYAPFAPEAGCFDTLLHNAAGELTEFTIGNLALKLDGRWWTPPLSCGMLPGVMRASLLDQGTLAERVLHLRDLEHAEGLALVNSVRGWIDVTLTST
jgi:para-aminobenzoate synthetase/4-amino-4-deoxychorismate lyase